MTAINNPLSKLMSTATGNLLSIYCTAGFPTLNDTTRIIDVLQTAGADMIEIGIPFSDPLADGPTIQKSNMIALENGMTLDTLLDQLDEIKFYIPVILMGYFNPILQFGVEKFCARCAATGISGLIIPDLPLEYYMSEYQLIFERYNLCNILLMTPQTSESRIRKIDDHSSGFIYAVSSSSTTGSKSTVEGVESYLQKLNALKLQNPIMTGFNINDRATFQRASRFARGAIIGSAFIHEISNSKNIEASTISFIKNIRS
jgi:tryptophan synthase alpha chain